MQLLSSAEKLQIITSAAVALDVTCHFVDLVGTTSTPRAPQLTAISTATTTDVMAAPTGTDMRNLQTLTARNKGASPDDVTLQINRGGTLFEMPKVTLQAGEILLYSDGGDFKVLDATGSLRTVAASTNPFEGLTGVLRADAGVLGTDSDVTDIVAAATLTAAGKVELATDAETLALADTGLAVTPSNLGALNAGDAQEGLIELAIQSEMEAGTDVVRAVTPGRQHFHPSACKCWGKAAGAGTLTVGYNVTSVADTGTGRLGVTIATDFSSANYTIVSSVASVATTLTVATVDNGGLIRNASQAAGVFEIWNYDDTATTHVAQDPQSYFWDCFGDI